ncbi:hypothetical protein [Brumicola pallidula]|jgi:hypothetical protein|uniref:Outer membrane lipoprotein BamD-like domain-containing protein n=1 Tax=Brumicola pallidula DSM 14239 = ACAM 615 TaxID=1121922 RepID=K7A1J5_9ALTE|nr:hypothetical protein [Glaciecola pallidula]GAC29375.1 hypothetical protein GPAL_2518 [Glaciecola pallidula DSM 14239 = ACAM 615]
MKRTRISTHYFSLALSSLLLLLTGCNSVLHKSTVESQDSRLNSTNRSIAPSIDRLDAGCHAQVLQRENSVGAAADIGQQIALANSATRCIENKSFFPQHPDNQIAMQLNALAVVNFIKAGESKLAEHSLAEFRSQFPQQDLLFADYTSFVDTAVALLQHDELSAHQFQVLNINTALRNELKRQEYWLKN